VIGRPQVGVLAVQGAFVEHEDALRAVGADTRQIRVPSDVDGLDGLVLPGGESTTVGLVAERSGLLDRLRQVIATGTPVFGTCAGMIMLARQTTAGGQALIGGMDTVVRRNAFGRQVASFEADLRVKGLEDGPFPAVFIRAPWIEEHGDSVEILATVGGHPVAARQDDMLVTAFHPEFTDDRRVHTLFVDMVRASVARGQADEAAGGAVRVRAQ
jgi:pyridoxal 5'-phosphate synthase pdxT subunit